jgi:hypothetical protein
MKYLSIWLATALAVCTAYGQTSQTTAVLVSSQTPTYLYGGQSSKVEGDIKRRGGDNFAWKGNGAVTWEVQIVKSGEYAVGLCHAAEPGAAGQGIQITGGGARLNYTVRRTEGAFRGNMAYEIVPVMGSVALAAGKQTITLSIANAPALGDYISRCMKNGGAVTINLGIYQDGSVDARAVDVLKEVRQRIRKE